MLWISLPPLLLFSILISASVLVPGAGAGGKPKLLSIILYDCLVVCMYDTVCTNCSESVKAITDSYEFLSSILLNFLSSFAFSHKQSYFYLSDFWMPWISSAVPTSVRTR